MATFNGFLIARLQLRGTRSEGPGHSLQQWDDSEIPVVKRVGAWQADPSLHPFLAKKVTITGRLGPQGILYDEIRAFQPTVSLPTPPTEPSAELPRLVPGDLGLDVIRLQRKLQAAGLSLADDGFYGSITRRCVEEFQAASGLLVTGIVEADTWAALG